MFKRGARHSAGKSLVSNLEWLMTQLPRDARISLEIEVEWFKNEPAVMAAFARKETRDWEMTHEVLRKCFPFNLSRFGHDYWVGVVESLPKKEY